MMDFFTGFLFGVVVTLGVTMFGIYKLFLRQGDEKPKTMTSNSRYIRHAINKHALDGSDVPVETCGWVNTILTSLCVEVLSSPILLDNMHKKLHEILNPADKPDTLGKIVVSDINMGTGIPSIDGVRVLSREKDDSLNAEVFLRYDGGASFSISTELWVNWPVPKFASLPVHLHVSFEHFEGTLAVSSNWRTSNHTHFTLHFPVSPKLNIKIGSTIGHSTKLVNVMQVSKFLEDMIYSFVNKELVAPSGFEVDLDGGKVSSVRKVNSFSVRNLPKITEKGEKVFEDLSKRSFSVSS